MKKIDKFIGRTAVYLIFVLIFYFWTRNFTASLFIAFLATVLVLKCFRHFTSRKGLTKTVGTAEMEDYFALHGIPFQIAHFMNATAPYFKPTQIDSGFRITLNTEPILIFPSYKFSPCGTEDVAKFFRIAKQLDLKKIWVLSKMPQRSTFLFASGLGLDFNFISSKKVHAYLYRQNALPPLQKRKKREKLNFKSVLNNIFTKQRAKYFLLSGLSLGIFCIFSPYKTFYIITACFALSCAVICFFKDSFSSDRLRFFRRPPK